MDTIILKTRSEVKVTVTQKWYATLRHPKMHPHTKFGIPTSKNIGDMDWTRKRDGRTHGWTDRRTDSAMTICLPKFLRGHKKILSIILKHLSICIPATIVLSLTWITCTSILILFAFTIIIYIKINNKQWRPWPRCTCWSRSSWSELVLFPYGKYSKISNMSCLLKKGIDKRRRPRSDCFWTSSLTRVFPVCYSDNYFMNSSRDYHFIKMENFIREKCLKF